MIVRPPDVVNDSYRHGSLSSTPYVLSTQNMHQLFRPFTFKLDALSDIPKLAPYLPAPTAGKKRKRADADVGGGPKLSREAGTPGSQQERGPAQIEIIEKSERGVMTYPLTPQQVKIVKQCWQQTTLIFAHLATYDQIIRLVALSAQVTIPYYGHKLFPNVRSVIFGSEVRRESISQQYLAILTDHNDSRGCFISPHPLSFALDWLVDDFDACVHAVPAGVREKILDYWAARIVRDEGSDTMESKAIAEERWLDLDHTSDVLDTASLPGLRRLTVHGVQAGTKLDFNAGIETSFHFAVGSETYSSGMKETLDSIAKSALTPPPDSFRQHRPVTLHNLSNLMAFGRKSGPKAQRHDRDACINLGYILWERIIQCHEDSPNSFPHSGNDVLADVRARLKIKTEPLSGHDCRICGRDCEEWTCVEDSMFLLDCHRSIRLTVQSVTGEAAAIHGACGWVPCGKGDAEMVTGHMGNDVGPLRVSVHTMLLTGILYMHAAGHAYRAFQPGG